MAALVVVMVMVLMFVKVVIVEKVVVEVVVVVDVDGFPVQEGGGGAWGRRGQGRRWKEHGFENECQ